MSHRSGHQVGDDLLDDRVFRVALLCLHRHEWAVAEDRVVAVGGEQVLLLSCDALACCQP